MSDATISILCMVASTVCLLLIMLRDKKGKTFKHWLGQCSWTIVSYLVVLAIWIAYMFYKGVF